MRFLYYSTSYYANHGGSIQSREFFRHLDDFPEIEEKLIYPGRFVENRAEKKSREFFRKILRKIPFIQILLFYRRSKFHINGLEKKIKEFKPDVIFIQIDSNFLQIKRIKRQFPHILICTQINGSPFDEPFKSIAFRNKFISLQRKTYEKSDLNIFISDFSMKRIMGTAIDPGRDIVIYNGTDPRKFFPIADNHELRKKWDFPTEKFILGYIGTLDFHKKLIDLVEVFNELYYKYPFIYLVIIGDGPAFSKIQKRIKTLNLEEKIVLTGWVDHQYVNEVINCFDVAVHHYANNYMNPLKIFEFLAAGLPVLAPDIPSVRSAFKDGEDILLTGYKREDLKKKLQLIISDDTLRNRLSNNQNLIKSVKTNYTWERYAERILSNIKKKLREKIE